MPQNNDIQRLKLQHDRFSNIVRSQQSNAPLTALKIRANTLYKFNSERSALKNIAQFSQTPMADKIGESKPPDIFLMLSELLIQEIIINSFFHSFCCHSICLHLYFFSWQRHSKGQSIGCIDQQSIKTLNLTFSLWCSGCLMFAGGS